VPGSAGRETVYAAKGLDIPVRRTDVILVIPWTVICFRGFTCKNAKMFSPFLRMV